MYESDNNVGKGFNRCSVLVTRSSTRLHRELAATITSLKTMTSRHMFPLHGSMRAVCAVQLFPDAILTHVQVHFNTSMMRH